MLKSTLIICFLACFIRPDSYSQELSGLINLINRKYENLNYFNYKVISSHKSLLADTIDYSYSTTVFCNRMNTNDSLNNFVCLSKEDSILLTFNNNLFFTKSKHKKEYTILTPNTLFNQLKRGDVKLKLFSPLIYKNKFIDSTIWNDQVTDYTIERTNDTLTLNMCNTFSNSQLFFKEDPIIGSKTVQLKLTISDTIVFLYEETLNISKRPEISTFMINDFESTDISTKYDSIFQLAYNLSNNNTIVDNSEQINRFRAGRADIIRHFSDTLILYDMMEDSITISSIDNSYSLLYFWFIACPACSKASKYLNSLVLNKKLGPNEIIGINSVDKPLIKIINYINSNQLEYTQYFIKSRSTVDYLNGYGLPLILLYDNTTRKIVKVIEGFNKENISSLESIVNSYFIN